MRDATHHTFVPRQDSPMAGRIRLRDGGSAHLRPSTPSDRSLFDEFFAELSDRDRFRQALEILTTSGDVDAVIVLYIPVGFGDIQTYPSALIRLPLVLELARRPVAERRMDAFTGQSPRRIRRALSEARSRLQASREQVPRVSPAPCERNSASRPAPR
jgi:hypothetical protein